LVFTFCCRLYITEVYGIGVQINRHGCAKILKQQEKMFQIEGLEELSENELKEVVGGTLQDDLNDFLALIPNANIEALFLDYLAADVSVSLTSHGKSSNQRRM
jgi:bacteriocin-like protein